MTAVTPRDRDAAPAAARRAARGALRPAPARRGHGRAGRRAARHDRERRAPAPDRARTRRARRSHARCRDRRGQAGPADARRTPSPRRRRSCSRRPTASSPTSCSATSPTSDPALLDDLFAKRREHRIEQRARRGSPGKRTLGAKVAELTRDPRRGRLPRDVRAGRARAVPHHRAQLRDLGGRAALRPGVHERDRLHPRRAPRGDGRARAAHGRRRAPLRLRDPRHRMISPAHPARTGAGCGRRTAASQVTRTGMPTVTDSGAAADDVGHQPRALVELDERDHVRLVAERRGQRGPVLDGARVDLAAARRRPPLERVAEARTGTPRAGTTPAASHVGAPLQQESSLAGRVPERARRAR